MSLQGLPDFQGPIRGEGFQIFYPYEGVGNHIVTPERLEVAKRSDGRLDFVLQFFRGQNPSLPPASYGVLDLRAQPQYSLEAALIALRGRHPQAMIDPAAFSTGYLRLYPQRDMGEFPADLRAPIPLAWNGLTTARYILRLSLDSALLLKGALQGDMLPLVALAEMEMAGVAPRLPLRVRFDPATLLAAMVRLADEERKVARDALLTYFAQDPAFLLLELDGSTLEPVEFAETITDWVRVRFGSFVASPAEDGKPHMVLASPDGIGSGTFEWDLSRPLQTWRPLVLILHPLEAARQVVQEHGLEAVVPPPTIVPPIPTGVFEVSVSANIPDQRPGVLSLGVTLRAAPKPPFRPQVVIQSAELSPPDDAAQILLRLSPAEELTYAYSTFVILNDSGGIRQVDGPEIAHSGVRLKLSPEDFPLNFVPVEANPELLDLAVVHGLCRWAENGAQISRPGRHRLSQLRMVEQAFEIDRDRPAVGLPVPRDAADATLHIEARAREDGKTLSLGPMPAKPLQLGLHSFPEYGPHLIPIECTFAAGQSLVAIELLPEARPDEAEAITVVALTRAQPRKEWGYLASSPFRAGYRYRLHAGFEAAVAPWSEIRSPFDPLTLGTESDPGGIS